MMASFQAKIGWKRLRKRKNKNYRSVPFLKLDFEKLDFQKKDISLFSLGRRVKG